MARARNQSNFGLFADKFIIKVPKQRVRRRKQSEAQQENADHFKAASAYAKSCTPELKALYETGITKRKNNGYTVACTDYLNPPTIHFIKVMDNGPAGTTITIKATDDFEVKSVKVTISGPDAKVIEEGEAIRNRLKRVMWKYETKVVSVESKGTQIKATAEDHAGNKTRGQFTVE